MGRILVVGAGGVANVTVQKLLTRPHAVTHVTVASRNIAKCRRIQERSPDIAVAEVNADNTNEIIELIHRCSCDLVINAALPYQDLSIMDACLETRVHYMDTANYEPPDVARFEYRWQWAYQERFRERGIMALLGCGFDPGMTNIYFAWAAKHLFDQIDTLDIYDCNAGDHGHPFATNFNPEVNIREITAPGRYWEGGEWRETPPLSVSAEFDFPGIGRRRAYLMFHEELESLTKNYPSLRRARFWMTFTDRYLTYLRVLQDLGLTRIDAVECDGQTFVPLRILKALLPDPATLGATYTGLTCIGCLMEGSKNGKARRIFIYNVCDHEQSYRETGSQAISYTTGVPAACGAELMLTGPWMRAGVFNVESLDPDPFMQLVADSGLPWNVLELPVEHDAAFS